MKRNKYSHHDIIKALTVKIEGYPSARVHYLQRRIEVEVIFNLNPIEMLADEAVDYTTSPLPPTRVHIHP
ncbi:hypothetical protein J6590_014627 [Homalodisca vitripennis]|nr:hypothetical protein J6590_014627 [Homalodisca vitripennis]